MFSAISSIKELAGNFNSQVVEQANSVLARYQTVLNRLKADRFVKSFIFIQQYLNQDVRDKAASKSKKRPAAAVQGENRKKRNILVSNFDYIDTSEYNKNIATAASSSASNRSSAAVLSSSQPSSASSTQVSQLQSWFTSFMAAMINTPGMTRHLTVGSGQQLTRLPKPVKSYVSMLRNGNFVLSSFTEMLTHCAPDYLSGKVILKEAAKAIINALLIKCSLYVGGRKHMFLRIGIRDDVTTLMDKRITPDLLDEISDTNSSLILIRDRVFQNGSDIDFYTSVSGGIIKVLWIDGYVFKLTGVIIVSKSAQGRGGCSTVL